ncbi:MAG: T9SS type A sorting domain-containing protein [Elusimicrobia bacterium]|nr:T9SS type A sorting domain-containing protein [Elusimicrobiota bacterium]
MTIGCLAADTTYYAQVRAINRAGVPTEFVSLGSTKTLSISVAPTTYCWAGAQWGMSIQSNELAVGDSVLFNETPTATPLLSSTLPGKIVAANGKLSTGGDGRRLPLFNGPAEILKSRGCPAQLVSNLEQPAHLNFNFSSNSGWVERESGRVREETLSFYRLDVDLGVWNKIPSQVKNGQVTATVKELGTLAVMGQEDVSLQDLRVSPNPFHQGTDTHITFANLSERATVKIFTPAGREVRRLEEADGDGLMLWDGRNSSGDAVEPGVYVYRVESPGSERQGKVMIMR